MSTKPSDTDKVSSRRLRLALITLFLVPFSATVNATILSSSLPAITLALGGTSEKAFWCGTGFMIARSVTTPIFGALSEAFGRRISLISALSLFIFASALCSAAQNIDWLLGARVVQGAAAGGLNAVVGVILTDIIPLRERGKIQGLFAISQFLGLPGGLLLGGVLPQYTSWRWIFIISIPLCAIAIVGLLLFLKLEPPEFDFMIAVRKLDWIGMVILSASIVSFLYGITTGGNLAPWSSVSTILPIVAGALGFVGFAVFEGYTENPLIPLRLFCERTAAAGFVASFLYGVIYWASSYYFIQYFLGVIGQSLFMSAVSCLPGLFALVASSACSGFLFSKLKKFQKLMWAAWALSILGTVLLSTLGVDSNSAQQYIYQIIPSLGGGFILNGRLLTVQAVQKDRDVGMATTVVALLLSLGQAFGVGLAATIWQNRWGTLVATAESAGQIPQQYFIPETNVETAFKIAASFPAQYRDLYRQITAESLSTVFIFCAALSGAGLLTGFISKDITLDKDNRGRQRLVSAPAKADNDNEIELSSTSPVRQGIV